MRKVWLLYSVLLTLLLFIRNPQDLFGGAAERAYHTLQPGAHLACFLVLAFLTLAARWPLHWGLLLALLAGYAALTELVQGLLPPRTPELADLLQDLAGIALGSLVWLALERRSRRRLAVVDAELAPTANTGA